MEKYRKIFYVFYSSLFQLLPAPRRLPSTLQRCIPYPDSSAILPPLPLPICKKNSGGICLLSPPRTHNDFRSSQDFCAYNARGDSIPFPLISIKIRKFIKQKIVFANVIEKVPLVFVFIALFFAEYCQKNRIFFNFPPTSVTSIFFSNYTPNI